MTEGTFIALRPQWQTARDIFYWSMKNGIMPAEEPADLHVTLMYAKNTVLNFKPRGGSLVPIRVIPSACRYAMFGPLRDILVLIMNHWDFDRRHYQLLSMGFKREINPAYSPAFTAHMTLAKGFNGGIETLPDFRTTFNKSLVFNYEYSQPLKK